MFVRSLTLGVAAAALLVGGAQAADLIIPTAPQPIYEAAGFSWDGLYAGVRVGGEFYSDDTTDGDVDALAITSANTLGVVGAAVGVNFIVADPILLGAEVTADYVWGEDDVHFGEFFANVRAGAVVTDSVLVYAIGGVGVATTEDDSVGLFQLGGGVELAVTDAITVRGEIVGQGQLDHEDGVEHDFFDNAKATVGVFYHF